MKIYGIEMPEDRLSAALLAMKGCFRARDVEGVVSRTLGADFDFQIQHRGSTIMRTADRLIQKARRDGSIKFANGYWCVVRDSDGSPKGQDA